GFPEDEAAVVDGRDGAVRVHRTVGGGLDDAERFLAPPDVAFRARRATRQRQLVWDFRFFERPQHALRIGRGRPAPDFQHSKTTNSVKPRYSRHSFMPATGSG